MVIGPKEVYKAVIEANNPQKLNAFMRAIVPSGRSAAYFSKANPSTVATFREAAQLARNGEMVNAQALLKEDIAVVRVASICFCSFAVFNSVSNSFILLSFSWAVLFASSQRGLYIP